MFVKGWRTVGWRQPRNIVSMNEMRTLSASEVRKVSCINGYNNNNNNNNDDDDDDDEIKAIEEENKKYTN